MGNRSRAISRRLLLGASGIGLAGLRCSSQQVPDRNTRVDRTTGINGVEAGVSRQQQPLVDASIGSAPELFVDRHLIASTKGVELRLHSPRRAEQALRFDLPWEGPASAYVTVFEDRNRYRMYYRGWPSTDLPDPAVLNMGFLGADGRFGGLGACGRSPERADRFESTPCQADRRPFRRSAMADLACGRASRRVPDSFYRRRPRDRRVLPQAPRPRARFPGS